MSNDEITIADDEPIHEWFGLSYASYLTLPRSVLQSMPVEWQRRFVACLREFDAATFGLPYPAAYEVIVKDEDDDVVDDPFADYERGRRRVQLRDLS